VFKKIVNSLIVIIFLASLCGCVAVVAGAAGGAGTSVWLSEKMSQTMNASYDRTLKATRSALKSLKLEITKETIEKDITQVMSKYTDGKTIWIDIRKVTDISSKVDVRVGAVNGDEEASAKILKKIQNYI
jgi:predicted RNA binding protein with dsRBD fold (UPF0201 family)